MAKRNPGPTTDTQPGAATGAAGPVPSNRLILGDNLQILRELPDACVDLVYLDPPFFSNRTYEVIWGDKGEVRSFEDRWSGGVDHYIAWLKERVEQLHRVLKPTGSIFLHCDDHAYAQIKVFILDKIFGEKCFRNMITWKRADTHNDAKNQMPIVSDYIYYYTKADNYTFHIQYQEHSLKTLKEWYLFLEFPDGTTRKMTKEEIETQIIPANARRFNADNMASPNPRPNLMYEYKGYGYPIKGWRYSLETMKKLDDEGKLLFPKEKSGRIMLKRFLDEQNGAVLGDIWTDIDLIRAAHTERIGYPTQKPEALMERIIQMASNEGDVVLDPFVGGGTTVVVAERLKRRWIGIDQSVAAVKVTEQRLNNQKNLFSQPFTVELHKYDYDTLRYSDAFHFEQFMVQQLGGTPNTKQRGDLGLDGRSREGTPIQVKRSDDVGRNVVDNFVSACRRYDKSLFEKRQAAGQAVGTIIAFSFGKGAVQEVARLKNEENIRIELVPVGDIVPIAQKPRVTLAVHSRGKDAKGLHEVELLATAATPHAVEFYSWDFAHDPALGFRAEVYFDREGRQTYKFKPGTHVIAVKAVDHEGLDGTEVVTLQVNGELTTRRG